MRGWLLATLAVVLALTALVLHSGRFADRMFASVALRSVEAGSAFATRQPAPARRLVLQQSLRVLRQAEERDPVEVRLVWVAGNVYMLLGNPQAAADQYQRALALEPRPEIYLNLGRAQLAIGDEAGARQSFAAAVTLYPQLESQVPAAYRP